MSEDTAFENIDLEKYDFSPIGTALKQERKARGISREALAEKCDVSDGYIKAIENDGKNPGFQLFWKLIKIFNISVDEFLYPELPPDMDTKRRKIASMIGEFSDNDVYIVEWMMKGLAQRKTDDDESATPDGADSKDAVTEDDDSEDADSKDAVTEDADSEKPSPQ